MKKILGFYGNGDPIYEAERGSIVTHAFIICSVCKKAVSTNRGPAYGSYCVPCYEDVQKTNNIKNT
jgi:hypothetical protein